MTNRRGLGPKFPLRTVFIGASVVSLAMWGVLLALIFTGHTKIIWTAREAIVVTTKVARKAHKTVGRLQGDKDLTVTH